MSVLLFDLLAELDDVHDLDVQAGTMRFVGEYRDVVVKLEPNLSGQECVPPRAKGFDDLLDPQPAGEYFWSAYPPEES